MPNGTTKAGNAPPLFIKVERYKEVMQRVEQLRTFALSMRDALDALVDMHKEIQTGLGICHKALDNLNANISILHSTLSRTDTKKAPAPKTLPKEIRVESPREIEAYVKGMYQQMERIKDELKSIE
jgi:hypothetical protein